MTLYPNKLNFKVKCLSPDELPEAVALIWEEFSEFEASEYSKEGVRAFRAALDDGERNRAMAFYGAFAAGELIGVLAVRKPQHIGYFFVKAEYQRKGVGRALFETMCLDFERKEFTVNSSSYAVEIYRKLGFEPTGAEQVESGIRYTPMKFG